MEKEFSTVADTFFSPKYTDENVLEGNDNHIPDYVAEFIVCVDSFENMLANGRLYSIFLEREEDFESLDQFLLAIEDIMTETGFPKRDIPFRHQIVLSDNKIRKSKDARAVSPDNMKYIKPRNLKEFHIQRGTLANFRIKIYFRKNSSIQGLLSKIGNEHGSIAFRSGMELLVLLRNTLRIEMQNRNGDATKTGNKGK